MSYAKAEVLFDFEGACAITGNVGSGKSSLVEAITVAIYGRGRGKSIDYYVRNGSDSMALEYRFEMAGETYEIVRKRSKKKKSSIEFYRCVKGAEGEPETRVNLAGEGVDDTQAIIEKFFQMDYETFCASSFLMQGQADEFTTATAGKRKEILMSVFGLNRYDEFLGLNSKELSKCEAAIAEKQQALDRLNAEVQGEGELLSQKSEAESKIAELREGEAEVMRSIEQAGNDIVEIRLHQQAREHQRINVDTLRKEAATLYADLEHDECRLTHAKISISNFEGEEAKLKDYDHNCAEFNRLQEAMNKRNEERAALEKEKAELQQIESEAQSLQQREIADKRMALQRARAAREQNVTALISQKEREIAAAKSAQAQKAALLRQQISLAEKRSALLSAVDCDRTECPFTQDAREAAAQRDVSEAELLDLEMSDSTEDLEQALDLLRFQLAEPDEKETKLEENLMELQQSTFLLPDSIEARKAAIPEREKQIASIFTADMSPRYSFLKNRLKELEPIVKLRDEVSGLRATVLELEAKVGKNRSALEEKNRIGKEAKAALEAMKDRTIELDSTERSIKDRQSQLSSIRTSIDTYGRTIGAVETKLEAIALKRQDIIGIEVDMANLREDLGILQVLREAYGKKGAVALVMEPLIAQIQDDANEIAERLTDGSTEIFIDSQRLDARGKEMIETLDIRIQDENGERPYEMYSGGEKFKVDLALRLGISKNLARRCGKPNETLVIDEGFGTQDPEGRSRIVDCIEAMKALYAKILVITHVPEICDRFENRIIVTKEPGGSKIHQA